MSVPDPLALWDGRWSVPKPDDYTPGLYRWHQVCARHLLKLAVRLTEADARLLKVIAYQWQPLSNLQHFWIDRLEREHLRQAA